MKKALTWFVVYLAPWLVAIGAAFLTSLLFSVEAFGPFLSVVMQIAGGMVAVIGFNVLVARWRRG